MAKRRNDTKPASGRATGQAKTSKAPRSKKTAKKGTLVKRKVKAVDANKPLKSTKKTGVRVSAKKQAKIKRIRSLAARKGWETRRENERLAEEKRKVRSERSKAVWAKRKRDEQLTERRKLLDIRDLRQIADDRIQKLEAKEKADYQKRFKELYKAKTLQLQKLTKQQLLDSMPDDLRLVTSAKESKKDIYDRLRIYEGFIIKANLKGLEKTSEMAGDVMRKFVETKVYGTELEFLQSLDTTRQILFYTGSWEETPDSILFGKLKQAYGTPQFEAMVEVLSNETGHSQRYLYSLFHSPDASVFS
jgi:hypothetical protein